MPAAIRGSGTLVALGFPATAMITLALWLHLEGAAVSTSLPACAVLLALTALSEQIEFVISPRMSVSPACGFLVASALVGGPLVGLCAGISDEALNTHHAWRNRSAWGGARALQGFFVGLVGRQVMVRGASGAVVASTSGLLADAAFGMLAMVLVTLDRGIDLRAQLRIGWRPSLLGWLLPGPALAAFLLLFQVSTPLALALAAGLLLVIWLGNRVRLRLEQSLADERLRSHHDALTGAPNRYALTEALAAEQSRIDRGGHPAAVCFIDLDLFREVNNSYGYAAGDQLLVSLYQRLRERLRPSDFVARWGGEEFVLLAPRVGQLELADFAERLRLLVADAPFTVNRQQLAVTCSVGAAVLRDSRESEATLEAASRLVRVAKLRRNAVEVEQSRAGKASLPTSPATASPT